MSTFFFKNALDHVQAHKILCSKFMMKTNIKNDAHPNPLAVHTYMYGYTHEVCACVFFFSKIKLSVKRKASTFAHAHSPVIS